MKTTIVIDKSDLPRPADIEITINELRHWRRIRANKDLPCGALDHSIAHLKALLHLVTGVYLEELNQEDPEELGLVMAEPKAKAYLREAMKCDD